MEQLTLIRKPIEAELQAYNDLFAGSLQHENALLNTALQHILKRRGKVMRPIMVLLAARYSGKVTNEVLHAAVALEMMHTASLVHDDVVDESDQRRGQQSVNAYMGNKVAVLLGDYLFARGLQHASMTKSLEMILQMVEMADQLAGGEFQQLTSVDSEEISEETYYGIIEKKTASLFTTCARVGAMLSGGSEEDQRAMEEFGRNVGLCFQLRDDIFDYDATNATGKPTCNDMQEGKLTLPLIHALNTAGSERHRQLALKVRRGVATHEEMQELIRFAKEQGGIAYTEQAMVGLAKKAMDQLDAAGRDPEIISSLRSYVSFVIDRQI